MSQTIDITLSADELEGTEATISQWMVAIGEQIKKGEPLIELETDKVSMEICAPETGILIQMIAQPGDKVETESVLGILSDDLSDEVNRETDKIKPSTENPELTTEVATDPIVTVTNEHKNGKHLLSPTVRRLLKENNLNINEITGTGKDGRVNRNDVQLFLKSNTSVRKTRHLKGTMVPHSNMRKSIAKHMVESLMEISPPCDQCF